MFTLWGRDQSPGLFSWQLCLPGRSVYTINLNKINKYSAQCYVLMPVRSFKAGDQPHGHANWFRSLDLDGISCQRSMATNVCLFCLPVFVFTQNLWRFWLTWPPSSGYFNKCHKHTCIWAPGPGPPIKIQSCSLVSDWLGKKYGNW